MRITRYDKNILLGIFIHQTIFAVIFFGKKIAYFLFLNFKYFKLMFCNIIIS